MGEDENLALVRHLYELANRAATGEILELVTEDVEWDLPPDAPEATSHIGKQGVRKSFEGWIGIWDSVQMEVLDLTVIGDQVLAAIRNRATARGSSAEIESKQWDVWTIRDGLVSSMRMFQDEDSALLAAETAAETNQTTEARNK